MATSGQTREHAGHSVLQLSWLPTPLSSETFRPLHVVLLPEATRYCPELPPIAKSACVHAGFVLSACDENAATAAVTDEMLTALYQRVADLLRTGRYDRVIYSAAPTGGLGTGIFDVGDDVKAYIVDGLSRVVEDASGSKSS